jgi:hypothetical protein
MLATVVCMSTIFGMPGDAHGGRTPTTLTGKPVRWFDVGIAHRRWKAGTRIRVENLRTGLAAFGVVIDSGPWGKRDSNGAWFNSRHPVANRTRKGTYRGCADLTPAMAALIGHNGREKVKITRTRGSKK